MRLLVQLYLQSLSLGSSPCHLPSRQCLISCCRHLGYSRSAIKQVSPVQAARPSVGSCLTSTTVTLTVLRSSVYVCGAAQPASTLTSRIKGDFKAVLRERKRPVIRWRYAAISYRHDQRRQFRVGRLVAERL